MAFEDLDAEISYLLDAMGGDQGDLREIEFRLRQALATLRAEGLPPSVYGAFVLGGAAAG